MAYQLFGAAFNEGAAGVARQTVADDAVIAAQIGNFTGSEGLLDCLALVEGSCPDATVAVTSISLGDGIVAGAPRN